MKIRTILIFLLAAILIAECGNRGKSNTIEKMIVAKIKKCKNDDCIIEIKQLTNFKWDKMFVFNYPVSLEVINEAIKNQYLNYKEFTRPIIFLYHGKVVHYENKSSDVESLINEQLVFDYPDSLKYKSYNNNVIFKIEKKEFEKGYYYELHQVN